MKHQKIRASSFKEIPKAILPSEPKVVQEEVDQEPISPSTPNVVEVLVDIPTSPESESYEEKRHHLSLNLMKRKDLPQGLR